MEVGGSYFILTADPYSQVIPIPADFYDGNVKHLVITYNSIENFEFYINGIKQEKSTTRNYFTSDGDGTFYIGGRARGNFFKGTLYNFRIYSKILSQNEIMESYNSDKAFLENNGTIMNRENLVLEYIVKNNESNIYNICTKFGTNKIIDRSNHNNNATAHDITYYRNKDGGIFNGESGYIDVNLNEKLIFPVTIEMIVKTSNENRTEVFYMEPNLGICFGSWRIVFYFYSKYFKTSNTNTN